MQYGLSDEQEMIAETVRSFVENEIYPHEDLVERTGEVPQEIADEIKRKTKELGFYACNFPESVGGAGLNHLEFSLVERELGRGSMALTHFFGRPQNILMACEGEQIERYLLPAVRGERMDALAMTEPSTSASATPAPVPMPATIESVLQEQRLFPPPADLAARAAIGSMDAYRALCERAEADPDGFWGEQARSQLHWFEPFDTVLDWTNPPFAKWFEGGTTNLSFNCLDRHLDGPRAEKPALIWEGEPGDVRTFTYRELHQQVCQAANALKALGVGKGDLVALYMPMVPEAAIAMLACARIGAPHSVVFGGFSADALRDRLIDGQAKAVITADGGFRKDTPVALKPRVSDSPECEPADNKKSVAPSRLAKAPRAGRSVELWVGGDRELAKSQHWFSDKP